MKRLLIASVMVVSVVLMVAAAAWAAKPEKTPVDPPPPTVWAAGVVCPFPLLEEAIAFKSSETAHFDKQGDLRWIHGSGRLVFRYTNVDNPAKSVDLNIAGPGKLTFPDPDTLHIDGQGPWSLLFFLGDALPAGSPWTTPTALYIKGHLKFTVDLTTGKLTLNSYTGTAENICDMLS